MLDSRPVGIRSGSQVAVVIDGDQCVADGIEILESANKVVLTEGIEGTLPPAYITQVYELDSGRILYTQRGGWLNDSPKSNKCTPDSPSLEEDVSPITRTNAELGAGYLIQSADDRRRLWVNTDPSDGDVVAKVELGTNPSVSEGSGGRNRESLPSVSMSAHSTDQRVIEEEEVDGSDKDEEEVDSDDWRRQKFFEEGVTDTTMSAVESYLPTARGEEEEKSEDKERERLGTKRQKCEKKEKKGGFEARGSDGDERRRWGRNPFENIRSDEEGGRRSGRDKYI